MTLLDLLTLDYTNIQVWHVLVAYPIFRTARAIWRQVTFQWALLVDWLPLKMMLNASFRESYPEHVLFDKDAKSRSFGEVEEEKAKERTKNKEIVLADQEEETIFEEPESQTIEGGLGIPGMEQGEIMVHSQHLTDKKANRLRRDAELVSIIKQGLLISGTAEAILMNNDRKEIIEHYDDWELLTMGDYSYIKDHDQDNLSQRYVTYVEEFLSKEIKDELSVVITGFMRDPGTISILRDTLSGFKNPLFIRWLDPKEKEFDNIPGVSRHRGTCMIITMGRFGAVINSSGSLDSLITLPENFVQKGRNHP